MRLLLDRVAHSTNATLGVLSIEGADAEKYFVIEDIGRRRKIPGKTRIPQGTYDIGLRTEGGFHQRYQGFFPEIHFGMLELQDVPDFEYVLIHRGNFHSDSAGCLLINKGASFKNGDFIGVSSTDAYKEFYPLVANSIVSGMPCAITVRDRD